MSSRSKVMHPSLPAHILKQLGVQQPGPQQQGPGRSRGRPLSRKEQRKAERTRKKSQTSGRFNQPTATTRIKKFTARPFYEAPHKPKNRNQEMGLSTDEKDKIVNLDRSENDEFFKKNYDAGSDSEGEITAPKLFQMVQNRLTKDDADIAKLEKKLGIKGRSKLPKAFIKDGLGDLVEDLGDDDFDEAVQKRKRKAGADDWLASKREKATHSRTENENHGLADSAEEDEDGLGTVEDDELGDQEKDGDKNIEIAEQDHKDETNSGGARLETDKDSLGSSECKNEEITAPAPATVRENPYVAPTVGKIVKYIPPSLRQESGFDAEITSRIRRQAQGLINRITDSNLVSILGDIEKMYRDFPRQHVTSSIVDLIFAHVCDRSSLPDTTLITMAGFATAVSRAIGVDFGVRLVEEVVERFDHDYEIARQAGSNPAASKETSNIITFVTQLFTLQLIGANLVFDYIRLLLDDLCELNAELLLRIVRMSGQSLRQDDPLALKDIVSLIRPAVAKIGEHNVSVRTKFMIETINDLKNNKMKGGVAVSAVVREHVTRMKKVLGSLNKRKLIATEPLRFGLKDIKQADKKGKWWLVGANWAGKSQNFKDEEPKASTAGDFDDDDSIALSSDEEDEAAPDLTELAREQKMNTVTQRSIFVTILSSTDYEDAFARLQKLRLNKDRRGEIPTVLIQCVGAEQLYNPYYTFIANKLCLSDRKVRYSFQDSLWKFFRRLGQPIFEDEADEADEDSNIDMRRIVNVAKMFGSLVARGAIGLGVLRCLDMPFLQTKTRAFVECMLVTVLMEVKERKAENLSREKAVADVFFASRQHSELVWNLQWFMKNVIRKTALVRGKEAKMVQEARKVASESLKEALGIDGEKT